MSKIWLPAGSDSTYGFTATTGSPEPPLDMDLLKAVMAESEESHREVLRIASKMVETPCPVCGRRPIVRDGPTLVVCSHTMAAIKRKCKPSSDSTPTASQRLAGVQIEVFDDGPARW